MTEKYKDQIDEKLIDQLISQIDPQDLIKKDGIFSIMKKKLVERALEAEMNHELGYSKHERGKKSYNRRNGNNEKTIIDNEGSKIRINVPRDREGEYEPQLVPKGFEEI